MDDPACSESSAFIKQFVEADLDDGMMSNEVRAPGEPEYVHDLLHNTVRVFYSRTQLSSGAFSVTVNSYEFPPTLSVREPTTLLRPVIIDGCAVSRCFNKKYSPYCEKIKNTEKVSWDSCKVLFLEPIFKCLIYFLLRGHKVSVLLPSYYLSAPSSGMKPKVDALLVSSPLCNSSQRTTSSQRGATSGAAAEPVYDCYVRPEVPAPAAGSSGRVYCDSNGVITDYIWADFLNRGGRPSTT
ncbi:hypothetical protein KIN20_005381 [Parelaphostrongylus tenuis]|uniref:Zc3h12a-like Ribonuclease NYN domain-containing protein n=1 Tax=Parelaphostrongylus tenuis TaxID=148309 RepID=A0AAD5ML59_PARTN|nr:hypothetical protein KIN20_005381 [Parelaphostrongylus tenuis]